jgi:hypothetical protein
MVKQQLLLSTAPAPDLQRKCHAALLAAGMPASEADEKAVELVVMVEAALKAAPSPDMTVAQIGLYRNESDSTVQRKMRSGEYESYLSGRDKRLATRESVEIDRGVCLLLGPRFDQGSRRGRPRKALTAPTEDQGDAPAGPSPVLPQPTA